MSRFVYLRYLGDSISLVAEIRAGACHASRTPNRSVVLTKASTSAIMTNDLNLSKCFAFAKELTLEAGKIFKCGFEGEKVVQTKANEWDVVTNYDREIEEVLIKGISAEHPTHRIIAEESSADKEEPLELTDDPTWFLDPIDGTLNFVHSFPQTCISVALAIRKEIAFGIIYNPVNSELYSAIKGGGAFLNDKPIKTSKVTELRKALITLESFVIRIPSKNRDIRLSRFEALVGASQGARSLGSAAIAMAYIARGTIDCFHMDALQPWDVAAGMLIIQEAGGTVIDTKGGAYNIMKPNTIAAATETLALETAKLIVDTDLKTQRKRLQRT